MTSLTPRRHSLADAVAQMVTPIDPARTGVVNAVNGDGTVDLSFLGGVAANVPVLSSTYTPASGDIVQVMRRGPGSLLVLGVMRSANVTATKVSSSAQLVWNIAAPSTADPGGASSGVYTYRPTQTSSYRSETGWNGTSDFVAQGAWETRWGYYQGCFFYGNGAFSNLKGRKVTRIRIALRRLSGSGVYAAEPISIYLTKNTVRPRGAPLYLSKVSTPKLATGATDTFDLPVSAGQALADGRAYGLGIRDNSRSNYLRLAGRADWADAGLLTISWSDD